MANFKVLAIDGGGIRGACPAAFLRYIEERIDAPIHRYFDLIVGTSTGGIIALSLSCGIPAAEILKLYRQNGETIFKRRHPRLPSKSHPDLVCSRREGPDKARPGARYGIVAEKHAWRSWQPLASIKKRSVLDRDSVKLTPA